MMKQFTLAAIAAFSLQVFVALGAVAQVSYPVDGGNILGLAWRERQKTYTSVGQHGFSSISGATGGTNAMGGVVVMDPELDEGEFPLEFRPGQTESAVVVPSVSGIVGQTIFSPAMAKSFVDSLNGELTAAGATIAAIEPMLAQHANISTSIGIGMANAQLQADATLEQQLSNNKQNGEQLRNQFWGCIADKMNEVDNYVRAEELCRGGKPSPAVAAKFKDFGTDADRMGPVSSPDHPNRWGGARDATEIRLSDILFVQHIGQAKDARFSKNAKNLRTGFQGLFGDISYDYKNSAMYWNNNPNVKSPRKKYVTPKLEYTNPQLKRPYGPSPNLNEEDYRSSTGSSTEPHLTGIALYDRYIAEFTYETLVGLMRAHCIYSSRKLTNPGSVSFNRQEDLFFELISANKGKDLAEIKKFLPTDGENPMGILSVNDFAFSGELGLWLSGYYRDELKIDLQVDEAERCSEIDAFTPAANQYMAVKRALKSKATADRVPKFLRHYLEFAETIARMRTLMIIEDTWGDSLKTLADTQYLEDASKLLNLAAGSLEVDRINADKIAVQQALVELMSLAEADYRSSVGTSSGVVTNGAKGKVAQSGGNSYTGQ